MTVKEKAEEAKEKLVHEAHELKEAAEAKLEQVETQIKRHSWSDWRKCWASGSECPYQNFMCNPYRKNRYGVDALTELSWKLTLWKKENVFPHDLKVRAPSVFVGSILATIR